MIRQIIEKLKLGSILGWLCIGAVVVAAAYMLLQPEKPVEVPEPKPRTEIDVLADKVRAINGDLALLFFDGFTPKISPPTSCHIAERFNLDDRSPDERQMLEPTAKSLRDRCAIATVVNAQIIENFRSITNQGVLPEGLMAFEVYLDDKWKTVGVFLTEAQCEEVVAQVIVAGIGVKSCREWRPRF
jgi:hypothetical protein